jgi:hypothetical protein
MQMAIEEGAPEMIPFLQFIDGLQKNPADAMGMKVRYNDKDFMVVITAVYLWSIRPK